MEAGPVVVRSAVRWAATHGAMRMAIRARARQGNADALCLTLHPAVTFGRRLLRDLAEMRKPPLTLVRRGLAQARSERGLVARWTALGCRPCSIPEAEAQLRTLATPR